MGKESGGREPATGDAAAAVDLVLPEETSRDSVPAALDEMRFRLLETVREYAAEQLTVDAQDTARRHADYYLALAERADPASAGAVREEWLSRLEQEHDNLRAALDWAVARREVEIGLRLAGALGWFWRMRGYRVEGRRRLADLLALAAEMAASTGTAAPIRARAKALQELAHLANALGDNVAGRPLQEESTALYRELGDPVALADSLTALGKFAYSQGDYQAARIALEESQLIGREISHKRGVAAALHHLANMACFQGNYEEAQALFEESLALDQAIDDRQGISIAFSGLGWVAREQGKLALAGSLYGKSLIAYRELGDTAGIALTLSHMGELASLQGDPDTARRCFGESLDIWRALDHIIGVAWAMHGLGFAADLAGDYELSRLLHEQSLAIRRGSGDRWSIPISLRDLGRLARHQGDRKRAVALLRESLVLFREQGDIKGVAACLESLAQAGPATGDTGPATQTDRDPIDGRSVGGISAAAKRSAQLLGAAESLRQKIGAPLTPVDRVDYERDVEAARRALGEEAFAAAWAEGRAMELEQAVECALAVAL